MVSFQLHNDTLVSTIGEILVEIVSLDSGKGFLECQNLRGPFASGAPAIFIDQIARLGLPSSIVGAVGDDDFGLLNIERLKRDGVDINAIAINPGKPTGIAFVRYRPDGQRDFLFTLDVSAATQVDITSVQQQMENTTHLHVVGSSMSVTPIADYIVRAVDHVKQSGGTVSFDPNVRPEIMQPSRMLDRLTHVLHRCDIFLPSEGELDVFFGKATEAEAISNLLQLGVKEIVIKRGRLGADHYSADSHGIYRGFTVNEVDPTGAGDCFGATYIATRLLGHSVDEAMKYACAAGALAVMKLGPMEGNSSLAELESFIRKQQTADAS